MRGGAGANAALSRKTGSPVLSLPTDVSGVFLIKNDLMIILQNYFAELFYFSMPTMVSEAGLGISVLYTIILHFEEVSGLPLSPY